MIKYNNSNINDWYFYTSDIVKVYRNNAVCYYKISGGDAPSGQTPCFAVVDDISQYSDREFEDVFNKADGKWYKLNNLNVYEEYGVYGSGRTITYYEGKLTIDDGYEYQYSGGSWANVGEVSGATATLPNVPFVLNYNANNYDATTHSIPMTTGQLNDTDAVAYNSPNNIVDHHEDGYITISSSSMRIRKVGQDISLFNRQSNSTSSELTIVSKAKTATNGTFSVITNRDSNYNWMYRQYSDHLTLHGNSETGQISCSSSNPDILSVRTYYDGSTYVKYNNWTQNTSTSPQSFNYGSTNNDDSSAGALFVGYAWSDGNEQWNGDFYWIYMAQENLTDDQVQQVIAYNEGGSQPDYPVYYDEMQDPPNNLSFSSMTEAEEYECPWVGMRATIAGSAYTFNANYEWEEATRYWSVDTTQWQTSTAYGNLPSSGYSFYQSFSNYHISNNTATTYITIFGYETFDLKIRSYGESCCDYVEVYDIDSESNIKVSDSNNAQALQWRDVSFSGISTNVEHTIKVIYKKDGSVDSNEDRGFIAIQRQIVATSTTVVQGEYICNQGDKYQKLEVLAQYEGSSEWVHTGQYIKGDLIESGSTDCPSCTVNFCGVDANGNDYTINNGTTTLSNSWSQPYPVEGSVGAATEIIGGYCFQGIKSYLSALTIGNTVTTISHEAFMETSLLTTLTIPSSVTQIDFWAFTRCDGLTEVIFEGTTPPTFTNQYDGVFHDYCPPVIYVPDSAVSAYRAIAGSVWTNQSWSTDIIQPISNR